MNYRYRTCLAGVGCVFFCEWEIGGESRTNVVKVIFAERYINHFVGKRNNSLPLFNVNDVVVIVCACCNVL